MAGASASQPPVLVVRVAVDQEISVRRVLVLAHAGFGERCVLQGGEAIRHEPLRLGYALSADAAVARIGIEWRTVAVERQLAAARLQIGKAVRSQRMREIDPYRQRARGEAGVAGRRREEECFL